ncbi:TylF/MycF/NovP-related O-methyltransferase [Bradyrhizobium sp. LCT2]|uniref:TylF/MycF/NovP-related O-methyltransferase n=1 Tax=Bradyrhizobium sp. LCT2 TaxID=2493093 RepID=UPI001FEDC6D7|nr:TylF/MycF/NovP-related O-methyltransferase [Bradyrhizobium sp. LCT2]
MALHNRIRNWLTSAFGGETKGRLATLHIQNREISAGLSALGQTLQRHVDEWNGALQVQHDAILSRLSEMDASLQRNFDAWNARLPQMERATRVSEHIESAAAAADILRVLDTVQSSLLHRAEEHALADSSRATVISNQITDTRAAIAESLQLLGANLLAVGSRQDEAVASLKRLIAGPETGALAIDLYLGLLEKVLTGTLHGDAAISDTGTAQQDEIRRAVGYDWPATAETMIGVARLRNVRMLLERAIAEKIPGDFIETGVWRGGTCIYARAILMAHHQPTRRVFVADSFRGLPPPDPENYPADTNDPHSTFAALSVSREEVERNFRRYGLLDENVVFVEGWFKDSLPTAPIEKIAVLRLDGDMYESTIQALNALYHKVSPGGFVIIDDYILKNCAQAVDNFRSTHRIDAPLSAVDGAAVWWQVPASRGALP